MDVKIDKIKELLKKRKKKYPNITDVWLKYIEKKIEFLKEDLNKAEKIFENIENNSQEDLPMHSIALLYLLNQEAYSDQI